ncbi:MAG: hypothetical protein ACLFUC_00625 [Bacteroidales bacterium]
MDRITEIPEVYPERRIKQPGENWHFITKVLTYIRDCHKHVVCFPEIEDTSVQEKIVSPDEMDAMLSSGISNVSRGKEWLFRKELKDIMKM